MAEGTAGARIADLRHQEGAETIFSIADISYSQIHKRALELGARIVGPRHGSAGARFVAAGGWDAMS